MKNIILIFWFLVLFSCNSPVKNNLNQEISLIDSLTFLLEKDSLNFSVLTKRSQIYFKDNKLNLAKADIDAAYSIFKNDINTLLTRGEIYFSLNKTRVSKESWERCLDIEPNNIICRENLTNLMCAVKDINCKSMIDTLAILQNGIISPIIIAYLKELKEYDSALFLLNNLMKKDSTSIEVLSLLSVIYSDTSIFNTHFDSLVADKYFNQSMSLYPNNFQIHYNFAKHKQNLTAYKEAIKYYQICLKLDSSQKQAYYNLGYCYMQLQKYQESIDAFTESIEIDNSFLLAYHARAYLYELINNETQAKVDWKNCLMINPSYIPALEALSR